MYLEVDIKTEVISGTRNPEFNFERRFTFEHCPPKVIDYFNSCSIKDLKQTTTTNENVTKHKVQ